MSLKSHRPPAGARRSSSGDGSADLPLIEWGVATHPLPGQVESGDRHLVAPFGAGILVAAIDGLGHGGEAASAAQLAVATLEHGPGESVIAFAQRCHEQLLRTRGVVMSLASFSVRERTMAWLGVGNVEGRLVRAASDATPRTEFLLLRSGVVGGQLPQLLATVLSVAPGDTLMFATDGVALPPFPELLPDERPQASAERILAAFKKDTDDALVLVARWIGSGP